jgi:hypothetical protein
MIKWRYHSGICLGGLTKTMKPSIKITDAPVEIRREHLSNTILRALQLEQTTQRDVICIGQIKAILLI